MKKALDLILQFQPILSSIILSAATSFIAAIVARRNTTTEYKDKKYKEIIDAIYAPLCKEIIDLNLNGTKYDIGNIKAFVKFTDDRYSDDSSQYFSLTPMDLYLKEKKLKEYIDLYDQLDGKLQEKHRRQIFSIFREISIIVFSSYSDCRKHLKYPKIELHVQILAMPFGKYAFRLLEIGLALSCIAFLAAYLALHLPIIAFIVTFIATITLMIIERKLYRY